jgi:hypothetical protein
VPPGGRMAAARGGKSFARVGQFIIGRNSTGKEYLDSSFEALQSEMYRKNFSIGFKSSFSSGQKLGCNVFLFFFKSDRLMKLLYIN